MLANFVALTRPKAKYDDPLTEQRARGLLTYLLVSMVFSLAGTLFLLAQIFTDAAESNNFAIDPTQIPGLLSPLFVMIFIWAVRNGYFRPAAAGIVALSLASLATFWTSDLANVGIIAFAIPVVTSGLLLGWRVTVGVAIAVLGMATGPTLINNQVPDQFIILTIVISIISALVISFGTNVQVTAVRFIRELNKLQQVMGSVLTTTTAQNENQLARNTINTIRDDLGYTFARIYLVDEKEVIQRIQTGLNMTQLNVDTDIRFGQRSGIYDAINSNSTQIIAPDADPLIRQHLLTGTQAALAVPVTNSQNEVIAVLDIQSEDLYTFNTTEIRTIEMIAAQMGQTLERIRLVANLREDLIEQDETIARQRERLLQYERTERMTTTSTWRDYLDQQGVDYLGYDLESLSSDPVESTAMTADIEAAIQAGDISIVYDGDEQIVRVPIKLRDQPLGAMTFKVPKGTQIVAGRQQELIRNVVQRLSLALENKRLFEQSQSQAAREITANEVGNLLLSSTDINTVLELAAENFNTALGAIQTQIRLTPDAARMGESEAN